MWGCAVLAAAAARVVWQMHTARLRLRRALVALKQDEDWWEGGWEEGRPQEWCWHLHSHSPSPSHFLSRSHLSEEVSAPATAAAASPRGGGGDVTSTVEGAKAVRVHIHVSATEKEGSGSTQGQGQVKRCVRCSRMRKIRQTEPERCVTHAGGGPS